MRCFLKTHKESAPFHSTTTMRGKYTILGAAICLLCASCQQDKATPETQAVKVEAMAIEPTLLTGLRIYPGTVEESEGIDVSFSVAGMMDSIMVREGDFVRKGQVIGRINSKGLQRDYDEAKAALDKMQAYHDEMKARYEKRLLSEMKWAGVRSALLKSKSNAAIAAKALDDATLLAPFTGYVSKRYCDAGHVVAPSVPVIKLANIDDAHILISIPEDEISNLSIGDTASVSIGRIGHQAFIGEVLERSVTAKPSTGAYTVRIGVDNTDYSIRPGMDCNVKINSGAPVLGIVLPPHLVMSDADNSQYVWIAYRGKALKRAVEIGGHTDSGVIIDAGVSVGDSIITTGRLNVNEFSPVLIANR